MRAIIELRGAGKSFGPAGVDRIDLQIQPGATTVLIGPSGCGKSTLLKLMLGLLLPDRGSVWFEGQQVTQESAPALRQRMGYVIQEGGLFPHLSARDNITLMARYLRRPPGQVAARLAELCELTRFPEAALDRFPLQLSGGQRQRVALMRALMLDPDVLLLDEPLGALDPLVRADLQADLRQIFRALQKTVVIVTHDMGEAAFFGDTIVLLRDGRIVQEGTLAALCHTPVDPFVTRFISAQRSHLDVLTGSAA
jgi:osmoprotectant transport system ATP-binding protein